MLITFLIIVSVVIFACVIFNSVSTKFGVPMLLVFILLGITADHKNDIDLYEKTISKGDGWVNKFIMYIPKSEKLIIMIRRGEEIIIPNGSTLLLENDVVVINNSPKHIF